MLQRSKRQSFQLKIKKPPTNQSGGFLELTKKIKLYFEGITTASIA